ncbi:FAD/NAD(P)-binding domain-containing protein, partial [Irpex lacteus]
NRGGGIGGLVFAVALAKTNVDFDVDIYESAASFSEIGAGIGLWPRVWDTLVGLGLEEDLKSKSTSMDQPELLPAGQAVRMSLAIRNHAYHTDKAMQSYHRAEFLKILEKNIPSSYRTHFGKRLVSYTENSSSPSSSSEPVTLHFKDGSTAKCDVLVGADGIRSAVRRTMFSDLAAKAQDEVQAATYRRCVDAAWSGVVTYRALVKTEAFKAEYPDHTSISSPVCYMGKNTIVLSYPISQGQMVNCVALVATPTARGTTYDGAWFSEASNDEMISHFSQWSPEVYALLKAMKSPSKWAVNEVRGLPTFVSGRVALLGDAAHAMTPHLASGAGQAIEDALVLATLLAHPTTENSSIPTALRIYDTTRRPFAQQIQDLSFKTGEIAWLDSPRVRMYRDSNNSEDSVAGDGSIPERVLREVIEEDMVDVQRWTWTTDPMGDVERAVRELEAAVGH